MSLTVKSFAKKMAFLSIVLLIAYGALAIILPDHLVSVLYFAFIPFFFIMTMANWLILSRQKAASHHLFANSFIITTILRFILYVGVLMLYSFNFPHDAVHFIITFFAFYFIYSLFEVYHLYHYLKN